MLHLGRLVATAAVSDWTRDKLVDQFVRNSIFRHANGDWGEVCDEDKQINNDAVKQGDRVLSAYSYNNEKIWIITESDRSVTTILFPSEY